MRHSWGLITTPVIPQKLLEDAGGVEPLGGGLKVPSSSEVGLASASNMERLVRVELTCDPITFLLIRSQGGYRRIIFWWSRGDV